MFLYSPFVRSNIVGKDKDINICTSINRCFKLDEISNNSHRSDYKIEVLDLSIGLSLLLNHQTASDILISEYVEIEYVTLLLNFLSRLVSKFGTANPAKKQTLVILTQEEDVYKLLEEYFAKYRDITSYDEIKAIVDTLGHGNEELDFNEKLELIGKTTLFFNIKHVLVKNKDMNHGFNGFIEKHFFYGIKNQLNKAKSIDEVSDILNKLHRGITLTKQEHTIFLQDVLHNELVRKLVSEHFNVTPNIITHETIQ